MTLNPFLCIDLSISDSLRSVRKSVLIYETIIDVDDMILVKMSDNEIKKIENQVYDLAFDIEMDTGVDISPIIKNEEQYEYWLDTLPFYKNIHEEGVIVNG